MLTLPSRSQSTARSSRRLSKGRTRIECRGLTPLGGPGDRRVSPNAPAASARATAAPASTRRRRCLGRAAGCSVASACRNCLAGLPAVGWLLLERAHDRRRERARRIRAEPLDRRRPLGDVLGDDDPVGAPERRRPGEHLVGDDTEGVEIAPAVDLLARGLLGAHVGGGADGHSLPRAAGAALGRHRARDAEVGQQRAAGGLVEQDVLRLHVAVHHAGPARGVERRGQVAHDPGDRGRVQPLLPDEPLPEALALDLVHDVIEEAVGVSGGVDRDDVGVAEPGDGARLGQEAAADRLVLGELGMDRLDGDPAVERGVGCEEDDAHTPATQLPLEPILRFQYRLECGEQVEARRRHDPTGVGGRTREYTAAAFGAHGSAQPPLDASPGERVALRAERRCFGLNPC